MKTSKLLEKAQTVLATRGLAKWALRDEGDRVCSFGAIWDVLVGDPNGSSADALPLVLNAGEALAKANGLTTDRELACSKVVSFNNAPGTTLGDVLQAFDAGIAYARAQEGE